MSLPLELEVDFITPELILPETLTIPIEQMSCEEYIEHLNYLKSDELPELKESAAIVVGKLSEEYSKVMFAGRYQILQTSLNDTVEFHMPNELKQFNKDLKIPYMDGDKRKYKQIFEIFEEATNAPKFGRVEFNPARIGDYGKTKNLFRGFPFANDVQVPFKFNFFGDIHSDLSLATASEMINHAEVNYPRAVRVIEHIFHNIADGNEALGIQILAYIADILQNPERSPLVALILKSKEKGTGKSILAAIIQALVGERLSLKTKELNHLIGKHNDHLIDKLVVVGEELSFGGSHDTNDKIKDLVSSGHQAIEPKFKSVIQVRKYFRLILCTNKDWAVAASSDERRYIIAEAAPHQAQNDEYFAPMLDENKKISKLMLKDLFNFLISLDISNVDLSKGVETTGLRNQKIESMSPLEQWWSSVLDDEGISEHISNTYMHTIKHIDGRLVPKQLVHTAYLEWLEKFKPNDKTRITNAAAFGRQFINMASNKNTNLINSKDKKNENKQNCYKFGDIEELKLFFDSNF